jgi:hypothetical protein
MLQREIAPARFRLKRFSPLLAALVMTAAACAPQQRNTLAPLPNPELNLAAAPAPRPAPRHAPSPRSRRVVRPSPRRPAASGDAAWKVGEPRPWKYIVIHHTATVRGNSETFDAAHRARGWDELGYHFVITNGDGGPDGQVEVGSRWRSQKWGAHCGGTPGNEYNNFGVGICLVGDFSRDMPSPEQMASLRKLVRYLMIEYEIPPRNVIDHREAPCASTACPGEKLHRYLRGPFRNELSHFAAAD